MPSRFLVYAHSMVVFVYSPQVGPFTWSLVAQHLQAYSQR